MPFQDMQAACPEPVRTRQILDAVSSSDLRDGPAHSPSQMVRYRSRSDKDLQRAEGCGQILLKGSENGTCIVDLFQRSPIRIIFPRIDGRAAEEIVLVNTAGGIAGGDRLECSVTALNNASIAVTSQAAEKVYQALSEPARIATRLEAREASKLAWLPQETIVFNWGRLRRETEIEFSSDAELLALEWLVLGRAASGEEVVGGHITDSWRVRRDGRLVWADSFRATDETFPYLRSKALLSDCRAVGTFIYFGPCADARLEFLRTIVPSLGCDCAATSLAGLIIARFAAKESMHLKLALRCFLRQFSRELPVGPFRVPKMWSC